MGRSGNPEHLYRRGQVWWICYVVSGKKVRRSLETKSVKEAKRIRDEILGKRANVRARFGLEDAAAPVPTVSKVYKRIQLDWEARGLRERSVAVFVSIWNKWLLERFGARLLSDIDRADVRRLITELNRAGHSRDHVTNVFGELRRCYRFARRERLYEGHDPTDIPNPPTKGPPRQTILEPEELAVTLAKVWESGDQRLYYMACTAYYAGLRWGEVSGLKWEDVDLDGLELTVVRSWRDGKPKTVESGATLPLHPELAALLRTWEASATTEWLFPVGRTGQARTRSHQAENTALASAAKAAGVRKHVTAHVLRHSYGTHLWRETGDAKAVQTLMRHADVTTTLRVYVKPDRETIKSRLEALPSIRRPGLRSVK